MNDMIKCWTVVLANYEGDDNRYRFTNFDSAHTSFNNLVEKHKHFPEYERSQFDASWFDSAYNEYSTFVRLVKECVYIYDTPIEID